MLDTLRFIYEIYAKLDSDAEKHEYLRSIILAESRFNNDLSAVIRRAGPEEVAKKNPELFLEFQTGSLDLLNSLGVAPYLVFEENREPTESDLAMLEGANKTLEYYRNRSQAELYEFYTRKCRLLNALARADALTTTKVSLSQRLRNIDYATRFLSEHIAGS